MRLYYYKDPHGNFGDDLNGWLWERLLPGRLDPTSDTWLCAIGTLIGPAMPPAARRWIVFSSGAGYGPPPADFRGSRWRIACVRGPLTARVLGLEPSDAATDGAMLLSTLPEFAPLPEAERAGVVFMPHHHALIAGEWQAASERAGIEFLDPRQDSRVTLERLQRAKLVIADAMHAAIVADALRVPWVPVTTSPEISTFKWLDWTLSLSLPYEPIALPSSSALESLRSATLPLYGYRHALPSRTEAAAMAHYRAHQHMKSSATWPLRRKLGHGLFTRLLRPVTTSRPLAAWRRGEDERHLDRAAEALRRAALAPGFLSEDEILGERLELLLQRLRVLEAEPAYA